MPLDELMTIEFDLGGCKIESQPTKQICIKLSRPPDASFSADVALARATLMGRGGVAKWSAVVAWRNQLPFTQTRMNVYTFMYAIHAHIHMHKYTVLSKVGVWLFYTAKVEVYVKANGKNHFAWQQRNKDTKYLCMHMYG